MAELSKKSPVDLDADIITQTVAGALEEDIGIGDLTAELVNERSTKTAEVRTRQDCVLCGIPWFNEVFLQLCNEEVVDWHHSDGDAITAGTVVCTLEGPARVLLSGERTALNFLQTLSATATQVSRGVEVLSHSSTQLLDTRKTLPGLRYAQKYAVLCGGGTNHRIGLNDAYLIKENHILACGGIKNAIQQARTLQPNKLVEVEVESIHELEQALNASADIVMLDNFSVASIEQAVEINKGKAKLEVSGNITIDRLKELSALGVDFISSGALTKNVQAIDLSMLFN